MYLRWGLIYIVVILGVSVFSIIKIENFSWYIIPVTGYTCWTLGTIILLAFIVFECIKQDKQKSQKAYSIILSILLNFIIVPLVLLPVDNLMVSWQKTRVYSEEYRNNITTHIQEENLKEFKTNQEKINSQFSILVDSTKTENGKITIYTDKEVSSILVFIKNDENDMKNNSEILHTDNRKIKSFNTFYRKKITESNNQFKEILYHKDGYLVLITSNNEVLTFSGDILYNLNLDEAGLIVCNKKDDHFASADYESDIVMEEKSLDESSILKLLWYKSTEEDSSSGIALVEYLYDKIPNVLEYNSEWNLPMKIWDYGKLFIETDDKLGNRLVANKDGKKIKFRYYITEDRKIGVKEDVQ